MNFGKIMQFWLWNQNHHHLQNHITSKREAQDGRDIKDGMATAAAPLPPRSSLVRLARSENYYTTTVSSSAEVHR